MNTNEPPSAVRALITIHLATDPESGPVACAAAAQGYNADWRACAQVMRCEQVRAAARAAFPQCDIWVLNDAAATQDIIIVEPSDACTAEAAFQRIEDELSRAYPVAALDMTPEEQRAGFSKW